MGQTNYSEFLEKIGVTIPEPRSMEGFGMELPAVYLSRCLAVIIPATEEYIKKLNDTVMEDFMTYVQGYKGFSGKLPIKDNVVEKAVPTTTTAEDLDSLRGERLEEIIINFLKKNPGIPRIEAIKQLNISPYRFDRVLRKLEEEKRGIAVKRKNDNAKKVTAEIIGKFFEENPKITPKQAAERFNVSISSINRRRREYAFLKKSEKPPIEESNNIVTIDAKPVEKEKPVEKVSVKEIEEISTKATPSYQKGGYMADIRSRFENRDKEPTPEEKAVEKKKSTATSIANSKKSAISFNSFSLLKYYTSLSAEEKTRAKEEDWVSTPADIAKVDALNKAFLAHGLKIRKRELTKIEYMMLLSVFNDKHMSFTDKGVKYSEYLV